MSSNRHNWIPVHCQLPNKPDTKRLIGYAPRFSEMDFKSVGELCGAKGVIDGKIVRGKHLTKWCLVALAYPIGEEVKKKSKD